MIGYHEASRSLRHWGPTDGVKRVLNNASRVINITWLVLPMRLGWGGKVVVLLGEGMHAWRSVKAWCIAKHSFVFGRLRNFWNLVFRYPTWQLGVRRSTMGATKFFYAVIYRILL